MRIDPFERRVTENGPPCLPERRVSQQVERLCGERETSSADGSADGSAGGSADGSHRCYEQQGHRGPHRCACAFEWGEADASTTAS